MQTRRNTSIVYYDQWFQYEFCWVCSRRKRASNGKEHPLSGHYLGKPDALADMISMYEVNEVIFCGKNHPSGEIISQMLRIGRPDVEIKIAPAESLFIIGSNSIHERGDLYFVDVPSINNPINRRNKRLFDMGVSIFLFHLSPVVSAD